MYTVEVKIEVQLSPHIHALECVCLRAVSAGAGDGPTMSTDWILGVLEAELSEQGHVIRICPLYQKQTGEEQTKRRGERLGWGSGYGS